MWCCVRWSMKAVLETKLAFLRTAESSSVRTATLKPEGNIVMSDVPNSNSQSRQQKDKNQLDDKQLEELLTDLDKAERDHGATLGSGFNIFVAAGIVRQEIRHSNALAYLLNPNEAHGMGDRLLKSIICQAIDESNHQRRPRKLDVMLADFGDAQVKREDDHIDVLVHSPSNKVVLVIENKVDAGEGAQQLKGYREKLCERFKDAKLVFVYLTVDGNAPSDNGWWAPVSYRDLSQYIADGRAHASSGPQSAETMFVDHYHDLIRRYILEDIDPKLKETCRQIYSRHKAILDVMFNSIDDPRSDAIRNFLENFKDQYEEMSRQRRRLYFLPKALVAQMPDKEMSRGPSLQKPVLTWFWLEDATVSLYAEVMPWKDTEARKDYIVRLTKEITNPTTRKNISDTYTRVWTDKIEVSGEGDTSEAYLEAMKALIREAEQANVFKALESVPVPN